MLIVEKLNCCEDFETSAELFDREFCVTLTVTVDVAGLGETV